MEGRVVLLVHDVVDAAKDLNDAGAFYDHAERSQ